MSGFRKDVPLPKMKSAMDEMPIQVVVADQNKFCAVVSPTEGSLSHGSNATTRATDCSGAEGCSIPFMIMLSAPRLAINMAWSAQWSALGPLLEILLSSSGVQLVQLVGPICGLLVVPTVGVLSDRCKSRYGRRRPFILFGAIASIATWMILAFSRDIGNAFGDTPDSRTWTAAITILCYIFMDITLNVAMVPVNLLMVDFAGERQVTGAVVGGIVTAGGQLAVSLYITAIGPAYETLQSFLAMLMISMFITTAITCWFAHETPLVESSSKGVVEAFRSVYVGIKTLPSQLGVYFIILGLTQYGYTAYNGAKGQFFGLVVKDGASDGADICGKSDHDACSPQQTAYNDGVRLAGVADMMQGVVLVVVLCLPYLVKRYGARRVTVCCIVPQMLLILMAFSKSVVVDVGIAALCSITQATIYLLTLPLVVHVVGAASPDLGMFSGALNSAVCVGQFLNYLLSSVLVRTSMGYALPVLIGGVMTSIAFVVALVKFHVNMHSM
ncbi:hypothetical protein LEN26_012783 [Aphanomyces euteiches]|nr:hypothetical protein LEN26_012783 [Aphanomyces euteiches]